jgi:hypothetical protein
VGGGVFINPVHQKGKNVSSKKLNQTAVSILTGMKEAVGHARGEIKAKTHRILLSKNIPNEEVVNTIEESSRGVNVNSYNSKDEFFKHLDDLQKEVE